MMTFPNEILPLILQDVWQLDDDEYEFAHRSNSTLYIAHITATRIAALLVCRRWQSIATSPFYRTIILSTAAQARCLARTLGDHPDLGSYVRKLLFNGGYGASARKILQAVPRIMHLCLSLLGRLFSAESVNSHRGCAYCFTTEYLVTSSTTAPLTLLPSSPTITKALQCRYRVFKTL